jgi:hypothetical protein
MRRKFRTTCLGTLVAMLVVTNANVAFGHDWWLWCWHKGAVLHAWVYGSHQAEALAALRDWDINTDLDIHVTFDHTNISVWGANTGATGWWGLASIEDYSFDWWHHWQWCRIEHCHATYNSYYGGSTGTGSGSDVRGVLCQEIGHCFGLDHSDTGDCMGKSYYNNINVTGPHNWSDINAKF